MEAREYDIMYRTEKDHWWFKGKRKIVFTQISKFLDEDKKYSILDVGCGTGIIVKEFSKLGDAMGLDIEIKALKFCQNRGLKKLVQGDLMHLPFEDNSYDIVSIFDVLYHKDVKDDVAAMRELFRIIKPGGLLVLTDSADMKLWSRHDVAAHARERYSVPKMSSRLEKAGFEIKKVSYFNTLLYPAIFAYRKLDNILNKDKPAKTNIDKTNPIVNSILYTLLWTESKMLKLVRLPFGVSIFVIGKKPAKVRSGRIRKARN